MFEIIPTDASYYLLLYTVCLLGSMLGLFSSLEKKLNGKKHSLLYIERQIARKIREDAKSLEDMESDSKLESNSRNLVKVG